MRLSPKRIDYAFIIVLTLVYALSYLDAAIILDNARDFYKVEQIVTGNQLILQGPDLAGSIHLSGWWFYWLSIVGVFKTKWLIALWVGLTAGTKFVFAYTLGKRLIGREFAILAVFAMTLPGWQTLEQFTFSHTNAVQALTLLFALILFELWQTRHGHLLKWLAVVFSMAVHAHPSTYGLLLFASPFLLTLLVRKAFSVKDIAWAVLLALLSLLPYLIQQYLDNWHDFHTASSFSDNKVSFMRVEELFTLWHALFSVGPLLFADVVAGSIEWWEKLLRTIYLLTVATSIIGYIVGGIRKTLNYSIVYLFAWGLCTTSICVLIVRDITPFYMTYVLLPSVAFIIAYGLSQIIALVTAFVFVTMPLSIGLIASTWSAMERFSKNDELALPDHQLRQVRATLAPDWRQYPNLKLDVMSFEQAEALDNIICTRKDEQLHGPAVAIMDLTFGVLTQFHCSKEQIKLSGNATGYALLGGRLYSHLEKKGFHFDKVGHYAVINQVTPLKSVDFSLAQPDDYQHPPRGLDTSQDKVAIETQLPASSVVMITDYLSVYRAFSEPRVTVNGKPLQAIAQNYYTRIYYCQGCSSSAHWDIAIDSVNEAVIDVVYFTLNQ